MAKKILREILEQLMKELPNEKRFLLIKRSFGRKYKASIPRNFDLYKSATKKQKKALHYLLFKKPTRSISGVSVVAVMCKPHKCPHGRCSYCPKGAEAPQSYTGDEPAARRARANKFDAYSQVKNRLDQIENSGHPTDKLELIVMGGTFSSLPWQYQKNFIRDCLNAISGAPKTGAPGRRNSLKAAQKSAETSKNRPVGITIETRPDYARPKHIKRMLELGATRVELGVQTTYDSIFKKIHRGHTVKDVITATRNLKNAGLKVCYHMMPGLPGSTPAKDLSSFKKIFTNSSFMPDMIKIYPTLVMSGTELYEDWKAGKFKPLTTAKATQLVSKINKIVPEWVRVMRVQRDIPTNLISAGVTKSNLRQLAKGKCCCIRCREVGHRLRGLGGKGTRELGDLKIQIKTKKYSASSGSEYFISAEDFKEKILIGYLRLRDCGAPGRRGAGAPRWIVRELHVYGTEVAIGKTSKDKTAMQHRGWGRKLLKKAEEIADGKLYVLSGIGAREYYRKFGYVSNGVYVSKIIIS